MLKKLQHINPDLLPDQQSRLDVTLLLNVTENQQKEIQLLKKQIQL